MRASRPQRTGIIEIGYRSIRKFFEHPVSTYAAALAYRSLFGLFPFVLILVVLAGALGLAEFLDHAIDHASAESSQHVPQQLEPVIERGREQLQPLIRMIEQAEEQAGGELLFFGVALALWSISALAGTLTEAFNAVYEVPETRRWWKVLLLSWAFGPVLALTVLAVVLSLVYRFGPDVEQRFQTVVLGAALAVVLWAISSVGFSFYLANFADYGATYGSLGAAVGLLFYLYLTASVVLPGTEVNASIYHAYPNSMMRAGQQGSEGE